MHSIELRQNSNLIMPERSVLRLIGLLGLATFLVYLVVGIYYVTGPISPFRTLKLTSTGDAFLSAFPGWNAPEEFDDAAYNRAALEILRTGIPRDHTGSLFLHAPVYAYFVAGCYWLGGVRLLALAIPQAILAALTCVLIGLTTYRIATRSRVAAVLIASSLFLINLRLAMYVGYVSPTILLEFFFALALLAVSGQFTLPGLTLFVVATILAIETQAVFFVAACGAAGWLLLRFFQTKRGSLCIASAIILALAAAKVLLPAWIGADSRGSLNEAAEGVLWEANNPYYESMTLFSLWERRPANLWTHWKMSTTDKQRYDGYLDRAHHHSTQAAQLWIRENPGEYGDLVFVRLWTSLGPFTGMMSPRNRMISLCIWLLIFPAGFVGWWLYRQVPLSQLAAAVTFTLTLFSALVVVEWYLRYRFPVELLMTVYAALGYSSYFGKKSYSPTALTEGR